jgi:ankyrin repeat protein
MEYSIICDEVIQAFQIGIESQKITQRDINMLIKAVFKEYPLQLLSFRGAYLLLDIIDILSSDRQDTEYKKLLSDVKCRTVNKQYAQWLLSIRSFALINLCWSIIKFYRKTVRVKREYEAQTSRILTARTASNSSSSKQQQQQQLNESGDENPILSELDGRLSSLSLTSYNESVSSLSSCPSTSSNESSESCVEMKTNKSKSKHHRLKSAKHNNNNNNNGIDCDLLIMIPSSTKYDLYLEVVFKNDFPDVLHYLITTKKCNVLKRDEHGRTLIFLAVMNEKPKILRYLVKRWPSIDINAENDSGNTPLHAAVNKGKLELVEIVLESLSNSLSSIKPSTNICLSVDKPNTMCMNATPLHLAVWNDYTDIALRLVQAKADPYLKMNGKSNAFDLAKENSNEILFDLLNEFANSVKNSMSLA